jgi:hypothetical protein
VSEYQRSNHEPSAAGGKVSDKLTRELALACSEAMSSLAASRGSDLRFGPECLYAVIGGTLERLQNEQLDKAAADVKAGAFGRSLAEQLLAEGEAAKEQDWGMPAPQDSVEHKHPEDYVTANDLRRQDGRPEHPLGDEPPEGWKESRFIAASHEMSYVPSLQEPLAASLKAANKALDLLELVLKKGAG